MSEARATYRLGCDVGGTFTDFVLYDERSGDIHVEKCLTTPVDPSVGILEGLRPFGAIDPEHVARTRRIAHATTLVANAVIERKGARTALLATRGFRDVLELRRHVRVTTYELWADPPAPLVPRSLRIPIDERTWSDGTVLRPVPHEEIEAAVALMRAEGVGSVAIAFLHSYVNPGNEREAARLVRELAPELAVTTSAEVLPQIKEYERTSTTVVNAYVKPLVRHYLGNLDAGLARTGYAAPLRVMLSNGGLGSTETAADFRCGSSSRGRWRVPSWGAGSRRRSGCRRCCRSTWEGRRRRRASSATGRCPSPTSSRWRVRGASPARAAFRWRCRRST